MARCAVGLAKAAGVALPEELRLWGLAGGRPSAAPMEAGDPGQRLGEALEGGLTTDQRRRGAHYTPPPVADRVVELALDGHPARPRVVDPACGGGALLLAAARRLAAEGLDPATIAEDLLWGADIDPLAAAVTEAAVALWSGGVAPAPGHLVVADTLGDGLGAWPSPPSGGFDVVVGNPPFQGQLIRTTTRTSEESGRLRARFGIAVAPYVDTAALFLLVGSELARPGGRMALVQPQSVIASRDARGVRELLAGRARLVDLWAPPGHLFHARVHVCVPVLEIIASELDDAATALEDAPGRGRVGHPAVPARPPGEAIGVDGRDDHWAGRWAEARGIPAVSLGEHGTLADLATAHAGFRDEYYGLVGHVREAGEGTETPLITSGLIDVGRSLWGERPARFAKHTWERPEVDLVSLRAADPRVSGWVDGLRRPKVVVASQTRVVEAAIDRRGRWVPSTPVVSVVPIGAGDLAAVAAVLCAPPVSAWAARRAAATALSSGAMRVSASLLLSVPLPSDRAAWDEAARAFVSEDLAAYAEAATAMFQLPRRQAAAVLAWWRDQAKLTWPTGPLVR
jgi:hypothetical protein